MGDGVEMEVGGGDGIGGIDGGGSGGSGAPSPMLSWKDKTQSCCSRCNCEKERAAGGGEGGARWVG